MNYTVRYLLRMGIPGFVIGMLIGNVLTLTFSAMQGETFLVAPALAEELGEVPAVILQCLLSGLVGFVGTVGTFVYYDERIGHSAATIAHCLMCLAVFLPTAHILWWSDRTLEGALLFAALIICMYALMWFAVYTQSRIQIKEINRMLEERRSGKR